MANLPPPNWSKSPAAPETPGQIGMALAMQSMFNLRPQLPNQNLTGPGVVNPYQSSTCAPFNTCFRSGIGVRQPLFQRNLHGFPGYPVVHGTNTCIRPPLPTNHHRPVVHQHGAYRGHSQRQQCQDKAGYKPASQAVTPGQTFSCDACERDFNSREIMDTHLAAHVECEHKGCTFKATRKVLKAHRVQAHSTTNVIKLDTPEEIAKWREERRRNYPTQNNVVKKKEEEENRRASGHVLNTTSYRYESNFGNQQPHEGSRSRGRGGKRNNRRWKRRDKNVPRETQNDGDSCMASAQSAVEDGRTPTSTGDPLDVFLNTDNNVTNLTNSKKDPNLPDRYSIEGSKPFDPTSVDSSWKTSSALNILCSSYGDMSSDEENSEDDNNNKTEPRDGHSSSQAATKADIIEPEPKRMKIASSYTARPDRNKKGSRRLKKPVTTNGNRKPTLLEMLLAPEVRHERNVILQCIRHIVKNNFFNNTR